MLFIVCCNGIMKNDGRDLICGKYNNSKVKNQTHKINFDINAMIIVSLTVFNGKVASLPS